MQSNVRLIKNAMFKVYSRTLKDDTTKSIRIYRNYIAAFRGGAYDYQDAWDCGRQDAFGDKVDQMIFEMRSNILALAIYKGDTRRLKKLVEDL